MLHYIIPPVRQLRYCFATQYRSAASEEIIVVGFDLLDLPVVGQGEEELDQ
jgi:hypothetical protein